MQWNNDLQILYYKYSTHLIYPTAIRYFLSEVRAKWFTEHTKHFNISYIVCSHIEVLRWAATDLCNPKNWCSTRVAQNEWKVNKINSFFMPSPLSLSHFVFHSVSMQQESKIKTTPSWLANCLLFIAYCLWLIVHFSSGLFAGKGLQGSPSTRKEFPSATLCKLY